MNFKNLLKHPKLYFQILMDRLSKNMDDKEYLNRKFKRAFGRNIDFENPQTFNEKLQWLKLHDRNPLYTTLVDKYKVKNFFAEKIGSQYVVPLFGVWSSFDEIDFDELPNQFVLKTNHDGGAVICKDKLNSEYYTRDGRKLSFNKMKAVLTAALKRNYYYLSREWPYKNVERKILAEQYLSDKSGAQDDCLIDYKFFCFNGEPKIMYISKDNASEPKTDFFDMDFNRLDLRMKDKNSEIPPEKPKYFVKMKELASKLSQGIPHVRVDFYCVNEQIYVGEMTFFHNGGFSKIYPDRWNKILGEWIDLSKAYLYR